MYSYFKNKEDIFLHVVRKQCEAFRAECRHLLDDPDVPHLEKIKKLVASVAKDHERTNVLVILAERWSNLKQEKGKPERSVEQWLQEIRLMFAELIREAVRQREIKKVDHEALSSILFGLLQAMVREKFWNEEMQLDTHLQTIYLMLDGLKA